MQDDYQNVLNKQRQRFEVLRAIYRDTNGREDRESVCAEVSQMTHIPVSELVHLLQYLQHEGLVKLNRYLGDRDEEIPIQILHRGVQEIEAAIARPGEPTEHFPVQVFNITNNAAITGGQQFGNQNTLNIIQQQDLAEAATELQQILCQLANGNPTTTLPEQARVVEVAIQKVENDPPLKSKIVGALRACGKEAFKNAVNHPLINIFLAAIEGWLEAE